MKLRQPLRIDGQGDRASDARLPRDQPSSLEGQQHLVHRGWADAEEALDVGFGGGATVQAPVGVDESEVLLGFKWSSQHLGGGGCDDGQETALGSGIASCVAAVTWSC